MEKKIVAVLVMGFLMISSQGCLMTESGILDSCCQPGSVTIGSPDETVRAPRVS